MNTRFLWAMGAYAVLALLAALTLEWHDALLPSVS